MADHPDRPTIPTTTFHCDGSSTTWTPRWEVDYEFDEGVEVELWADVNRPAKGFHIRPKYTGERSKFRCGLCGGEWEDVISASLIRCYPVNIVESFLQESNSFSASLKKDRGRIS